MAEIPVEHKKSGLPWWLIPLALLLLILLLFLFLRGCNNSATVVGNTNGNINRTVINTANNNGTTTANNTAIVVNNNASGAALNSSANGAITDVEYFGGAADQSALVGRQVNFAGARVNRVVSDRVFTIKSGKGEFFVMLDDALNAGSKEQQIQIKPGQNLKLDGEFRSVPTGEVKDEEKNRDLSAKNYAQMKNQKVYLHATSVSDAK